MMKPSSTYTALVSGALVVDPKLLVNVDPALESWDAFVTAANEAIPASPPRADGFVICPDLVPDDGYSQRYSNHRRSCCADASEIRFHPCSSASPPPTPGNYYYPYPPQSVLTDHDPLFSPITLSPTLSATRKLLEAPCAAGMPIKKTDGTFKCSVCDASFKRRDDTKRHIDSAGMRITCKYCEKPSSGRRDGQRRHLDGNKRCLKLWKVGVEEGRFTERTVEDAYN